MSVFNLFKRKKQPRQPFFVNLPKDQTGFNEVVAWVKQASEIVIDLSPEGNLGVQQDQAGKLFIVAYTAVTQSTYQKGDHFMTGEFTFLAKIFEENTDLDSLVGILHPKLQRFFRPRLIGPDMTAMNILGKSLVTFGQGKMAGIIYGAKVPIVITSRASSSEEKLQSLVLAALVAAKQ